MIKDLEEVLMFASIAHEGQKMFEPKVSYVTHIVGVASNVLEAYENGSKDFDLDYALKLALLHDTIEDTNVTYKDIEDKFGKDVAIGVSALTKNDSLDKSFKMADSINRIKLAKREVAIVKLADRIYNLRCAPSGWSKEKQEGYVKEGKLIYDELGFANEYLANKLLYRITHYLD